MNTPIEQGEQGRWHKGAIADHYEADLARLRTEVETLRTRAEQAEANADHWHVAWDEATAQLVQAEAKAALADEAAQWAVSHQANPFDMQDWLARYDALERESGGTP